MLYFKGRRDKGTGKRRVGVVGRVIVRDENEEAEHWEAGVFRYRHGCHAPVCRASRLCLFREFMEHVALST